MSVINIKNTNNAVISTEIPEYVLNFVDVLNEKELIKSLYFSNSKDEVISEMNFLIQESGYAPAELEIINIHNDYATFTSYQEWKASREKINTDLFLLKINELVKQSDAKLEKWDNDEPYNDIDDGQEHHNEMGFNVGLNQCLKIYKEIILDNQVQNDNSKNYVTKLEKIIITIQQENEKLKESLKLIDNKHSKLIEDKQLEFSR
ncbi:hypothetical protein [Spiroplasma sp. DGKH1]|uniref:hypothetical protein n=1 Tax=Spiroplasma sp. DGKH1 TaxID=3050074 RepID=UPI0034C66545